MVVSTIVLALLRSFPGASQFVPIAGIPVASAIVTSSPLILSRKSGANVQMRFARAPILLAGILAELSIFFDVARDESRGLRLKV